MKKKNIVLTAGAALAFITGAVALTKKLKKKSSTKSANSNEQAEDMKTDNEQLQAIPYHEILKSKYSTCRDWLYAINANRQLDNYLKENGYKNIAVYGYGEIGVAFVDYILKTDIKIDYIIDNNADRVFSDIKVLKPSEILTDVDVIVVSVTYDFANIYEDLTKKVTCPVISLDEVILGA